MATKIYCPKCEWRPEPHHKWVCDVNCRTMWNTFETHGRCPGCGKQWRVTQCLACCAFSPHDDWYHEETMFQSDADVVEEELVGVS
jgi:hypothetical protein